MSAVKNMNRVVFLLVAALLALTACTTAAPTVAPTAAPTTAAATEAAATAAPTASATPVPADPLGKYDPPITLSTVVALDSTRVYPEGMTWDNNMWTQAYADMLGINLTYLWTVDSKQYTDKLNIAIAADDLPDVMVIPYNFFYKLAGNARLADLTGVYEQYTSEQVKPLFQQSNGYAMKNCTIDGKLYGLANPSAVTDNFQMLYVRNDWAKKLSLSEPKTADDVLAIAKAFAAQDPDGNGKADTVGLGVDNTLFFDGGMSLEGFFNMYKAYPRVWIEKDGKLQYGSVQSEMKTALGKLAELYAVGAIDKDFSIKGPWDQANADGSAGKIGMAFGVSWFPGWFPTDVSVASQSADAYYQPYLIPAEDGSAALTTGTATLNTVACASVNCKYPEAVVKLSNLATMLRDSTTGAKYNFIYNSVKGKNAEGKDIDIGTFFFNTVGMAFSQSESGLKYGSIMADAISRKDPSALKGTGDYDKALAYIDGKDWSGYAQYRMYGPDQSYVKTLDIYGKSLYVLDKFSGPQTETMTTNMPNLSSKEVEIYTQIIMGAKPLDEFDKWVQYFNEQGGSQITDEVNAWYDTVKGK